MIEKPNEVLEDMKNRLGFEGNETEFARRCNLEYEAFNRRVIGKTRFTRPDLEAIIGYNQEMEKVDPLLVIIRPGDYWDRRIRAAFAGEDWTEMPPENKSLLAEAEEGKPRKFSRTELVVIVNIAFHMKHLLNVLNPSKIERQEYEEGCERFMASLADGIERGGLVQSDLERAYNFFVYGQAEPPLPEPIDPSMFGIERDHDKAVKFVDDFMDSLSKAEIVARDSDEFGKKIEDPNYDLVPDLKNIIVNRQTGQTMYDLLKQYGRI